MEIMIVVNPAKLGISHELRGKIGSEASYGGREYGNFEYGQNDELNGIWQIRTRFNRRTQVRMKYYIPTNPQTETQQAWRLIFSNGVVAWQFLDDQGREEYKFLAKDLKMNGFNFFMSKYLLEHR